MREFKVKACTGVVVACSLAQLAGAAGLSFDPDGAGPNPAFPVSSISLLPGNSLNRGALAAGSTGFTSLFQARVDALLDEGGTPFSVVGLNDPGNANHFELTVTAQFDMDVVVQAPGAGDITTVTELSPAAGVSFFRFYYDTSMNAVDLSGQGFVDGTLILDASVQSAAGSFTESTVAPLMPLDGSGANDHPGILSRSGLGGSSIDAAVLAVDPAFFHVEPSLLSLNSATIDTEPLNQVDPSRTFFGSILPAIGGVNGVDGPDVQLQTEAIVSFTVVPEPGSTMMAVLGAFGLSGRRRRGASSAECARIA
jgi:hypothetical protein